MLANYYKTVWRHLLKDRQFTFLNLLGLSAGLACTFLIYLWVHDELNVDTFNKNNNRLYAIKKNVPDGEGGIQTSDATQALLAGALRSEVPEVAYAVSVRTRDAGVISDGNKPIKAKPLFVEPDFFHVFSYPLLEGTTSTLLTNKHSILVSNKFARTFFNTSMGIVGKTVTWDDGGQFNGLYTIGGVFKAPPANATEQFDLIFPFALYYDTYKDIYGLNSWGSNGVNTYVLLKQGVAANQFARKIKDFTKAKIRAAHDDGLLQWEGDLLIQRYSDRYLYNHFENGVQAGGRIEYVKLFSVIAIFILLIACINFMNLATAKASRRMKEVGIKKVVGANRSVLVLQYIGESMLMAFAALLFALVLVAVSLPVFEEITGKTLAFSFDANLMLAAIGITFLTGLIAGSYPAFYLSGFKPISVLKGKFAPSKGEAWVRRGLVVFQFAISVILIVAVVVVYRQMRLIQTANLGYNKDHIIRFANEGAQQHKLTLFLSRIKDIPGVVNASSADGDFLGHAGHSGSGIDWKGKDPNLGIEYYGVGVDYGFIETMGLKMSKGRPFSTQFGSDSSKVIFNEAAIAAMGLKDPVGKTVSLWGQRKEIIGVVKNYHFESLYKKVAPAFLTCSQNNKNVFVKVKGGAEQAVLARIAQVYKQYNPGLPFEYNFLDADYQALYASEQRVAVLSRYFAGIAILISCLGLFGLAAFTAQRRQKEIGIRKVVGASAGSVTVLLSKDFLKPVSLALLLALPVSWWAAHQWLQGFAYRIDLGADVFLITAAAVFLITLLTVSFQAIKAALANPVKSLRTE